MPDPLEDSFLSFAERMVSIAEARAADGGVPTREERRMVFDGTSSSVATDVLPFFERLLGDRDGDSQSWINADETIASARAHYDAGLLLGPREGARDSFETSRGAFAFRLQHSLAATMSRTQEIRPLTEELLADYRARRAVWSAPTVTTQLIAVLHDTELSQESIVLDDQLVIERASDVERSRVWNKFCGHGDIGPTLDEMGRSSCQLRLVYTQARGTKPAEQPHYRLFDAVTALRLCGRGGVGFRGIHRETPGPSEWTWGSTGQAREVGSPLHRGQYRLDAATIPRVVDTYGKLRALREGDRYAALDVSLSRVDFAYERVRDEDRIIDTTIALESTLLGDVRDELKYRLMLRGALALSSQRDPVATARTLGVLYDARSGIVHAGQRLADFEKKIKDAGHELKRFVDDIEDLVKDVVLYLLGRIGAGNKLDGVLKDFDKAIVASMPKPS